jgi:hypothetical protein
VQERPAKKPTTHAPVFSTFPAVVSAGGSRVGTGAGAGSHSRTARSVAAASARPAGALDGGSTGPMTGFA